MTTKRYVLLFLMSFPLTSLWAQNEDIWTAFPNEDSSLTGYKNAAGEIKISPRFSGLTTAQKFENIIAVSEKSDGSWSSYYLTRSGKIIGRDSLYIIDNAPDCENEGFIRFRDPQTGYTGLFNSKGEISIPAVYNDLTKVRNGMLAALTGAEKTYRDQGTEGACSHFSWSGGREILLDTLNNILADSFYQGRSLDFFSLEKTGAPHPDTTRSSFQGRDGSYYSFIDMEKEFRQWITQVLLSGLTEETLISLSHHTLTWESPAGWQKTPAEELITQNFTSLKSGLSAILHPKTYDFISRSWLNPFLYEEPDFDDYFNNCGESRDWVYPTMTIIISHDDDEAGRVQDHYEFLRTGSGYRLIGLSIKKDPIQINQR